MTVIIPKLLFHTRGKINFFNKSIYKHYITTYISEKTRDKQTVLLNITPDRPANVATTVSFKDSIIYNQLSPPYYLLFKQLIPSCLHDLRATISDNILYIRYICAANKNTMAYLVTAGDKVSVKNIRRPCFFSASREKQV